MSVFASKPFIINTFACRSIKWAWMRYIERWNHFTPHAGKLLLKRNQWCRVIWQPVVMGLWPCRCPHDHGCFISALYSWLETPMEVFTDLRISHLRVYRVNLRSEDTGQCKYLPYYAHVRFGLCQSQYLLPINFLNTERCPRDIFGHVPNTLFLASPQVILIPLLLFLKILLSSHSVFVSFLSISLLFVGRC